MLAHCFTCDARVQATANAEGNLVCDVCSSEFCEAVEQQQAAATPPASGPTVFFSSFSAPAGQHAQAPNRASVMIIQETIPLSMDMLQGLTGRVGGQPGDYASSEQIDRIMAQLLAQYAPPRQPTSRAFVEGLPRLPVAPDDAAKKEAAAAAAAAAAADGTPPAAPSSGTRYASCCAGEACTVCHEAYGTQEQVVELPCQHCFHEDCILPWLKEHNTCPVCRRKFEVETSPDADPLAAVPPAAAAAPAAAPATEGEDAPDGGSRRVRPRIDPLARLVDPHGFFGMFGTAATGANTAQDANSRAGAGARGAAAAAPPRAASAEQQQQQQQQQRQAAEQQQQQRQAAVHVVQQQYRALVQQHQALVQQLGDVQRGTQEQLSQLLSQQQQQGQQGQEADAAAGAEVTGAGSMASPLADLSMRLRNAQRAVDSAARHLRMFEARLMRTPFGPQVLAQQRRQQQQQQQAAGPTARPGSAAATGQAPAATAAAALVRGANRPAPAPQQQPRPAAGSVGTAGRPSSGTARQQQRSGGNQAAAAAGAPAAVDEVLALPLFTVQVDMGPIPLGVFVRPLSEDEPAAPAAGGAARRGSAPAAGAAAAAAVTPAAGRAAVMPPFVPSEAVSVGSAAVTGGATAVPQLDPAAVARGGGDEMPVAAARDAVQNEGRRSLGWAALPLLPWGVAAAVAGGVWSFLFRR